jgi:hypothetical protein
MPVCDDSAKFNIRIGSNDIWAKLWRLWTEKNQFMFLISLFHFSILVAATANNDFEYSIANFIGFCIYLYCDLITISYKLDNYIIAITLILFYDLAFVLYFGYLTPKIGLELSFIMNFIILFLTK